MRTRYGIVGGAWVVGLAAASAWAGEPGALLGPSDWAGHLGETPALRARAVTPDLSVLPAAPAAAGARVRLDLFGGEAVTAVVTRAREQQGFTVYDGTLEGHGEGEFLAVAGAGVLTAQWSAPGLGAFFVSPIPGGAHALSEIDFARFDVCGNTAEHTIDAGGEPTPVPPYAPRGTPTIRVLVVYTAEARDLDGGEAAIQSRVVFAINQANAAYPASQAVAQLELAYAGLVDYVESDNASTDLSRFRGTTDGFMDNVHCLRNLYAADMCALLVSSFNACGIGYLQGNPGPGFAGNAFTVTDKDCIPGYTFAHELGHNMGCHHDHDNGSGAFYPYAYGYRTPDNALRTILAYAPGTRVGRFSNPNITYNGYVMGVATGDPLAAYNAQVITNNAGIVEAFRAGVGRPDADYNQDGNLDQGDIELLIDVIAGGANPGGVDPDYDQDGNADQGDVSELVNVVAGGTPCP